MPGNLLAAGAVLVLWTLIMLVWVAATRFPAMAKAGIDVKTAQPGGRGADLEPVLPPGVNWKSHNYTHLLEQPTLFYAVIVFLHLSGGDTALTQGFAWAYVVLRIVGHVGVDVCDAHPRDEPRQDRRQKSGRHHRARARRGASARGAVESA